jgi:hypothetical protein
MNVHLLIIFSFYIRCKIDFYIKKCNDLEQEKNEAHENHIKDTEEWKKFQADLQTAVRVANDFMNGLFPIYFHFILFFFSFHFIM